MFAASLKVLERTTPQGIYDAECPHNASPQPTAHASAGGWHSVSQLHQYTGAPRAELYNITLFLM